MSFQRRQKFNAEVRKEVIKFLCGCESSRFKEVYILPKGSLYSDCGDDSVEDPPVLIPNTEVKLYYAESTCRATGREDRQLPHFIKRPTYRSVFCYVRGCRIKNASAVISSLPRNPLDQQFRTQLNQPKTASFSGLQAHLPRSSGSTTSSSSPKYHLKYAVFGAMQF